MIDEQRYRALIQQLASGGIAGNKTYHQVRDQYMPMDSESMEYANGGGVGSMMQPRQNYAIGGDIEQSDFSDIGLQTITNSGLPEYDDVAFKSGSALDRQINKLNQLEQMGFPQPNLEKLKQMDMKQFQKTGTPLSLSPELYATANNIMSDVSPTSTTSTQSYGRPSMRDITGEDLAVNENVIDRGNPFGDSRISSEELGISGYGRPSMANIAGSSLPSDNVMSVEEIEEQTAANKNKFGLSSLMDFAPFGKKSISGMALRGLESIFSRNPNAPSYQSRTPGLDYSNLNTTNLNDFYDSNEDSDTYGTNRFDRATTDFGRSRTLADYFGRVKERAAATKARSINKDVYNDLDDKTGNPGGSFSDQQNSNKAATDMSQGNTGMGSCFIAGTKITMSDGTLKNIENIKVGDKVKGHKEDNEVIKLDPTLLANRKLYSFNNNEHYFFTSEHPFMTEEGWKSVKPEKTKERDGVELYEQLKGELKVGDKVITDNGPIKITSIDSKEMNKPDMPLYNFNVSNDNSYIADDYVVHNKGCFIKGTLITMADGTKKPVEQVDLGDEVAVGGKVFAVGRFLNTELYDYKGIKVSGSHMVNEEGDWMRVRDTKHGKSLGNDENTVYVFGSENRRILINDILFTDYFEIEDQEQLLKEEDKFFDNWKTFANDQDKKNVNTLNAS